MTLLDRTLRLLGLGGLRHWVNLCEEPGCWVRGMECCLFAQDSRGNWQDFKYRYCWKHAAPNGFCPGCGEFWGGVASFDLRRLCDNCASTEEIDVEDDHYYDDEFDYSEPEPLVP